MQKQRHDVKDSQGVGNLQVRCRKHGVGSRTLGSDKKEQQSSHLSCCYGPVDARASARLDRVLWVYFSAQTASAGLVSDDKQYAWRDTSYLALDVYPSESLDPGRFEQVVRFAGREPQDFIFALHQELFTTMVDQELHAVLDRLKPELLGQKHHTNAGFVPVVSQPEFLTPKGL